MGEHSNLFQQVQDYFPTPDKMPHIHHQRHEMGLCALCATLCVLCG